MPRPRQIVAKQSVLMPFARIQPFEHDLQSTTCPLQESQELLSSWLSEADQKWGHAWKNIVSWLWHQWHCSAHCNWRLARTMTRASWLSWRADPSSPGTRSYPKPPKAFALLRIVSEPRLTSWSSWRWTWQKSRSRPNSACSASLSKCRFSLLLCIPAHFPQRTTKKHQEAKNLRWRIERERQPMQVECRSFWRSYRRVNGKGCWPLTALAGINLMLST